MRHEQGAGARSSPEPLEELTARELLTALDEELQRLPERYRVPLVLCHLESRTCDEAARQLGCSTSTLKRRLEVGRRCLHGLLSRRGLALPAALLAAGMARGADGAAVPPALAGATLKAASSGAGLPVTAGAARFLQAARTPRAGLVAAVVVLAGAVTWAAGALSPEPNPQPPAPRAQDPSPAPGTRQARAVEGQTLVTGTILGSDGKPLAGALVAVVGNFRNSGRGGDLLTDPTRPLAQGKADAGGAFRLTIPRTSSAQLWRLHLLARADGHGLGFRQLELDREKLTVSLRLARERPVRGRLVDLQGQPAAGVMVRLHWLGESVNGNPVGVHFENPPADLAVWPAAAKTDAQGRFEVRGLGEGAKGALHARDDRYAPQTVYFGQGKGAEEVNHSLPPAQRVEGRVLAADTGKPLAHALLTVYAGDHELGGGSGLGGRANDAGRFGINPYPGKYLTVTAHAPDGAPYLSIQKMVKWSAGKLKEQVDMKLPRGVLIRGKVTEGSKPVAGASVQFIPQQANNPNYRRDVVTGWEGMVPSDADGNFRIPVLPGPGHLLVTGPTGEYLHEEVGANVLYNGRPGGMRYYPDALVKLDLPAKLERKEVTVALRRGVTVRGTLVGPNGESIDRALMICRLNVTALSPYWRFPVEVSGGRFELPGVDPQKSVPVSFLVPGKQWGTTVELSGKQAKESVAVRLQKCAQAHVRFVTPAGKPVEGLRPMLEIVVTPGAWRYNLEANRKGMLAADSDFVANIDRHNYWKGPATDAQGRVTLPALIPGVTYQLGAAKANRNVLAREFTAVAGKTIDLGDVTTSVGE